MTRSLCACLLVAVFAAPGVSLASTSTSTPVVPEHVGAMDVTDDASIKPGKSKKYKKRMSKQMNKRKRH